MGWPLAQVVDSLDRANVLFDFNPGKQSEQQMWLGSEDFDYGAPEFDNSVLGVVEGARTISLAFRARGRYAESGISRLSEILTRTVPGYLMWQTRKDSEPLWFRLHRQTSANPLDFSTVWADDADQSTWRWKVDLVADAFALGARVDLPPMVLGLDGRPENGHPVEITDPIIGDAPAPLNLDFDCGDVHDYATRLMSWSVDPFATVDPWAGLPPFPDISLTGAESARIGSLPQTPPPGQFRVVAYILRTSSSGKGWWTASLDDGYGHQIISTAPTLVTPAATSGAWVDLGPVSLPAGMDYTDLPPDALGEMSWTVGVTSSSPSVAWSVLAFCLIPVATATSRAGTTALVSTWSTWWPSGRTLMRVDSERSRVGLIGGDGSTDDGKWVMVPPPIVDGSFPRVHPGARNLLMWLSHTNFGGTRDFPTASGTVDAWYYPRHLHIGAR
ncbi:hypothetical protein [Flexivirga sp.]|uniref:hypothetical protein n=1 Tax=Flexivirga sp. TaxID=1962927 RepID=UPI003F7E7510